MGRIVEELTRVEREFRRRYVRIITDYCIDLIAFMRCCLGRSLTAECVLLADCPPDRLSRLAVIMMTRMLLMMLMVMLMVVVNGERRMWRSVVF